jgi:hypothetical protein
LALVHAASELFVILLHVTSALILSTIATIQGLKQVVYDQKFETGNGLKEAARCWLYSFVTNLALVYVLGSVTSQVCRGNNAVLS